MYTGNTPSTFHSLVLVTLVLCLLTLVCFRLQANFAFKTKDNACRGSKVNANSKSDGSIAGGKTYIQGHELSVMAGTAEQFLD